MFINYETQVILLLYLDDLVLTAPTTHQINWIRNKLHNKFEMTDVGELRTFLGLQIERDRRNGILHLSQTQYIQKILANHGMESCNPTSTPANPHIELENSDLAFEAPPGEEKEIPVGGGIINVCHAWHKTRHRICGI